MQGNMASIKKFQTRRATLTSQITNAEDLLPRLKKQIAHLEENLPLWKDRLRVTQLSLDGHNTKLSKQYEKLDLITRRNKLEKQLADLDRKCKDKRRNIEN